MEDEARGVREALSRATHDKDVAVKRFRAAELSLRQAADTIPELKVMETNLTREITAVRHEMAAERERVVEVKKEVDISMSSFLKEEGAGKGKASAAAAGRQEVGLLEATVEELRAADRLRVITVNKLSLERDRLSKQANAKQTRARETATAVAMRELEARDMRGIARGLRHRVRDFEKLHDLVKAQKNKFVNLVQVRGRERESGSAGERAGTRAPGGAGGGGGGGGAGGLCRACRQGLFLAAPVADAQALLNPQTPPPNPLTPP